MNTLLEFIIPISAISIDLSQQSSLLKKSEYRLNTDLVFAISEVLYLAINQTADALSPAG